MYLSYMAKHQGFINQTDIDHSNTNLQDYNIHLVQTQDET